MIYIIIKRILFPGSYMYVILENELMILYIEG